MKPPSARTTPRRLMAPISRHFLPVLQPEPPAWLTTGLTKGSRLPLALYLLSGTTDCSLSAFSPPPATPWPAAAASADAFSSGAAVGAGCTICSTKTAPPRLARSLSLLFASALFASAERASAGGEDDFTGVATLTALDLAGGCVAFAGAEW